MENIHQDDVDDNKVKKKLCGSSNSVNHDVEVCYKSHNATKKTTCVVRSTAALSAVSQIVSIINEKSIENVYIPNLVRNNDNFHYKDGSPLCIRINMYYDIFIYYLICHCDSIYMYIR